MIAVRSAIQSDRGSRSPPVTRSGGGPPVSPRELMTILSHFSQRGHRDFQSPCTRPVQTYLRIEFPDLLSQSSFVALTSRFISLACGYGCCTGLSFIDSTFLAV